jgi:hypothetical protein
VTTDQAMTAKQRWEAYMTAQLESLLCGLTFVTASVQSTNEILEHILRESDYRERCRARELEIRELKDAWDEAKGRAQALQRQGSPDASSDPERSRAIAGPSTPLSSSGSIM